MLQRSEIRKDPIVEHYVIIAPRRGSAGRPHDTAEDAPQHTADSTTCVFCPKNVDRQPTLYRLGRAKGSWKIKVVANIFPAVSLNNPKAYGVQEVIIETPDHTKQLDELSVPHIRRLFEVYAERTRSVSRKQKIEYILIFKNSGGRAGASIQHSHSQVFATNFIPPHLLERSRAAREYFLKNDHCVYCDMIRTEERGPRKIYADKYISVFAPYASQNNYEVWMFPRRHFDNVTGLRPAERNAFAIQLKRVLQKISGLRLPYNYYFHQVVTDKDQHFYIKIRPRGSIWAGVEVGSGVIINAIAPEAAARYFRS